MIKIRKTTLWLLFLFWFVAIVWNGGCRFCWAQDIPPALNELVKKISSDKESNKKVSMDFDNVDIRLVIKYMSDLTGKNFILDDRVKGKVTVLSPTEIPVKDAFKIFESILEVNGYTTVVAGNVIKVIPDSQAASKNLETVKGESPTAEEDVSDTMVTQLISLQYADVERVKAILQPLISRESKILSYLPTNTLILTERVSNINRLMTILKELDIEIANSVISIIPIKHGDADTLAKQIQTLFGERTSYYRKSRKTRSAQGSTLKILPDSRTGNIIVMAEPDQLEEIKDLIRQLDVPVSRDKDDIHVYFLKNSKADDMAKVLAQIMSKTMAKPAKDAKPETPLTVVSDKATNSLIITASSVDYGVIERVLEKLDIMRPQVLVEALIAEVSYDKSRELGVEWRAMREPSDEGELLPLGGTSFGKINSVMANPLAPPSGMFIGLTKGYISMGGTSFPNLASLIAAYQTDSDVNILSTPHILTTDNEEAEIIVGQEVPFAGSREVLANNTSSSIYSINYKNVGLTLRLTPHINQDDYVKLEIYQEIKQVVDATVSQAGPIPTTTIRQAKTTVVVKNGQTVVLGGLIQDDKFKNSQRVPCLGSIPVLGLAFKSSSKRGQKRNLQIFITPHIVTKPEDIDIFTKGMRDKLEEQAPAPQSKTGKATNAAKDTTGKAKKTAKDTKAATDMKGTGNAKDTLSAPDKKDNAVPAKKVENNPAAPEQQPKVKDEQQLKAKDDIKADRALPAKKLNGTPPAVEQQPIVSEDRENKKDKKGETLPFLPKR
ncbi:MAG: type II secretion system secretin GspD [bacterium]